MELGHAALTALALRGAVVWSRTDYGKGCSHSCLHLYLLVPQAAGACSWLDLTEQLQYLNVL